MAGPDPFARGPFPVGVRTSSAPIPDRPWQLPVELWYPAASRYAGMDLQVDRQDLFEDDLRGIRRRQSALRNAAASSGTFPLVLFSHSSGGGRRQSTFLCTHLASHGMAVAALDHAERIAPELAPVAGEASDRKQARIAAMIERRVPDLGHLLDHVLALAPEIGLRIDRDRIAAAGHSFGGWTALAAPDEIAALSAVIALAPAGGAQERAGMLPLELHFGWGRDVPTLYLAAEGDTSMPLESIRELFRRTPATKRMAVLRHADHMHFMDDARALHEIVRTMPATGVLAEIQQAMRPASELCSEAQAAGFVSGLAVAHLDAAWPLTAPDNSAWPEGLDGLLRARGIDGFGVS